MEVDSKRRRNGMDTWIGFNEGVEVARYASEAEATAALTRREVQSVAPIQGKAAEREADGTSPFSNNRCGYYTGAKVATRRGKIGTVVAIGDGTVDVKFGSQVFTMKDTDLVHARFARSRTQRQFHGR
jgi:hypothetical protein